MACEEPVDERQRSAHAPRERLVVGIALERVDPDHRVGSACETRHLPAHETGILALPAVRDDHDDRAAGQPTTTPDLVELPQRRADPRPAAPVDDLLGTACERGHRVARGEVRREA